MQNEVFSRHMNRLMVIGALFASMLLAWKYGWHKGEDWVISTAFVIGLTCVSYGEYRSYKQLARSWNERWLGSAFAWGILGLVLSFGVLWTNFSTAASNSNKSAEIHTASFNSYDAVQSDLASDRAKLKQKEERLSWMLGTGVRGKPVTTLEGADAKIDEIKAHRFWKLTNECTETKGPQTRQFCADFAAAKEDKALAIEKRTIEAEIPAIKERITKNQSLRVKNVSVADDAANIDALKKAFNLKADVARYMDAMLVGVLIQAILCLGGFLDGHEEYRGKPRKPWFTGRLTSGLARLWHKFAGTMNVNHHSTINQPISPQQALESGVARLKQSFAGA